MKRYLDNRRIRMLVIDDDKYNMNSLKAFLGQVFLMIVCNKPDTKNNET
jgi:hypothetical protein